MDKEVKALRGRNDDAGADALLTVIGDTSKSIATVEDRCITAGRSVRAFALRAHRNGTCACARGENPPHT